MILSAAKRFLNYIRYCYFHYTIVTTIAMLEPKERHTFNAFFLLFISLFVYTSVVYLPGHLQMMFQFILHISGVKAYSVPDEGGHD